MSSINAKVPPLRLSAVDTPADGEIPSYQSSSGDFEWIADSSGSPGTPADAIQYNSDPAGTFTASSLFTWVNNILNLGSSGASTAGIKSIGGKDMEFSATQTDGSTTAASVIAFGGDTTQDIGLFPLGAAGKVQIGASSSNPGIISTRGTDQNLALKVSGTGAVEVGNTTSDNDTTFQVAGNGTGKPIINLKNDAKSASLEVTTNNELTIKGGTESFVFDVSSATGGLTFPDGTELKSAEGTAILSTGEGGATKFLREDGDGTCSWQAAGGGVTFPLEADAGDVSTPSYSFDGDTDMGMYRAGDNDLRFSAAGIHRLSVDSVVNGITVGEGSSTAKITSNGSTGLLITTNVNGAYTEPYMKINAGATGSVYLNAGGTSGKIAIGRGTENSVQINEEYYLPTAVTGTNNYVLTAQTDGTTAWAAAAESLTLSTLQSEVAASSDFADFQSRIAAL